MQVSVKFYHREVGNFWSKVKRHVRLIKLCTCNTPTTIHRFGGLLLTVANGHATTSTIYASCALPSSLLKPNNIISTTVTASMALAHQVITALVFALVLARVELSTCHVLKGSVTCLDCNHLYDLSDIKVLVKCSRVKKLATATTEEDGTFAIKLPLDTPTAPSSLNCLAKILGGPRQLYTSRTKMVSNVINVPNSNAYMVSTPLKFYTSCPRDAKCRAQNAEIGSSKTIDLPLPREWGLAPTSYYAPFIPIIGIP